ncbi:MAG: penicillin-binding transpeptidase domain-containing protein, partial [Niameybacter sp.]
MDLKQAFVVSSNVVYGTLAGDLGNDKLKATAEKFGFNKTIPSNGFKIAQSTFPKLESSEIGSIAQSGIGQSSIISTPMQMALVASTIANNGTMMEPKLVNEVKDMKGNTVKTIGPKKYSDVLEVKDAMIIQDYMTALVDKNVSNGTWGYLRGLDVAGKTGTATYLLPNGQDAEPHSWFIGFAPADDPQIAIAVIVENGGYGSGAAATVAGQV